MPKRERSVEDRTAAAAARKSKNSGTRAKSRLSAGTKRRRTKGAVDEDIPRDEAKSVTTPADQPTAEEPAAVADNKAADLASTEATVKESVDATTEQHVEE